MTDIHSFPMPLVPTPAPWQERYGLRPLLCLDAVQDGNLARLVLTADARHQAFLAELLPGASVQHIAGGSRASVEAGESLSMQGAGAAVTIPVRSRDDGAVFEGRNTLFAITTEPDADSVADWISYHRDVHGAEATLIAVRARPGWNAQAFASQLGRRPEDLGVIGLVAFDHPLGQPDQPEETARLFAPDAPGKARLAPADPDPWRAPLLEVGILEALRQRFLDRARAVLRCDPSDLVAPLEAETVFDVVQSGTGFVRFRGRRAYPFSLKKGAAPSHGDHGCVAFDGDQAENIWCVAPQRLPSDSFWRQFRVSTTSPDEASRSLHYWRCMAIRHPGLTVSELVPKTALVADRELMALVTGHFGAEPASPPAAEAKKQFSNDRILVVTTMKNEGPFILEWLAWNRSIGVTDFLVYTNDCDDGTDRMLDILAGRQLVEHRANPYRESGEKPQHAAYRVAADTQLARDADWIICMDVDEFINIHVGDGTLTDLFSACPDATMISLTWRLFGNGHIGPFRDQPVMEQFTRCAPLMTRKPHQAWGFKTLFRNLGHYKKFGVHRPKGLRPEYLDAIHYVNGSGVRMPDKMLRSGWRSSKATVGYELATLNHYACRSAESFLVKRDRGRVNHVNRDQGLNYWFRMNHNKETDQTILRHNARFRTELARLLSDPEIAAQHAACVTAHEAKIRDLLDRPDYAAFFATITSERLRALSEQLDRFGTRDFEDGPDKLAAPFGKTTKS